MQCAAKCCAQSQQSRFETKLRFVNILGYLYFIIFSYENNTAPHVNFMLYIHAHFSARSSG